jgi:hypothetical protein
MQILEMIFAGMGSLARLAEIVLDFVYWNEDWERTNSPVSYYLAWSARLALISVACALVGAALHGIATLFSR